jgi:ribosomal protein S12 methylthiotransferase accessory factor
MSGALLDRETAMKREEELRRIEKECVARVKFSDVPDVDHDSFESDVIFEVERLASVGIGQVIFVDLERRDVGIPVVRVIAPGLEGMSEVGGFLAGDRGERAKGLRPG